MGRRIYESNNCVWKYVFGEQASEQARIAKEIGVGSVERNYPETEEGQLSEHPHGDTLTLTQEDKKELEKFLNEEISISIVDINPVIDKELAEQLKERDEKEVDQIDHEPLTRKKAIKLWKSLQDTMFDEGIPVGGLKEGIRECIRTYVLPQIHFWQMVKAYKDYMDEHDDREVFHFYGEY